MNVSRASSCSATFLAASAEDNPSAFATDATRNSVGAIVRTLNPKRESRNQFAPRPTMIACP
jgi:hypothetical protein